MRAGVLVSLPHFEGIWSYCSWRLSAAHSTAGTEGYGCWARGGDVLHWRAWRSFGYCAEGVNALCWHPLHWETRTVKVTGIVQDAGMCSTGVPDAQASV